MRIEHKIIHRKSLRLKNGITFDEKLQTNSMLQLFFSKRAIKTKNLVVQFTQNSKTKVVKNLYSKL